MTIIVGLVLLGLVFITFEVIVPGGVLGFLGAVCIIVASGMAYQDYGVYSALGVFFVSLFVAGAMLYVELKYLPKTSLGAKMFVRGAVTEHSTEVIGTEEMVGKEAECLTTMAPTGRIFFEGKEYEAFSRDGLVEKGERVEIVSRDNFRIVVKKKDK